MTDAVRICILVEPVPALPSVASVLRIALIYHTSGTTQAGCRFYFSYTGTAPSNSACASIAASIASAHGTDLSPMMSTNFNLVEVEVTDLSSPTSGIGIWTGAQGGTRSGNAVSIDNAVNLQWLIARRYRGGKPKIFLPFGTEGDTTTNNNDWSSTFVTAMNSAWSSFATALGAISASGCALNAHVSVSYYKGFVSSQNPVTLRWRNIPTLRSAPVVDGVTGHSTQTTCGVQRRRRTATTP